MYTSCWSTTGVIPITLYPVINYYPRQKGLFQKIVPQLQAYLATSVTSGLSTVFPPQFLANT